VNVSGFGRIGSRALTNRICYLEEGDWAEMTPSAVVIHDATDKSSNAKSISRLIRSYDRQSQYRHFMLKEIFEQPP